MFAKYIFTAANQLKACRCSTKSFWIPQNFMKECKIWQDILYCNACFNYWLPHCLLKDLEVKQARFDYRNACWLPLADCDTCFVCCKACWMFVEDCNTGFDYCRAVVDVQYVHFHNCKASWRPIEVQQSCLDYRKAWWHFWQPRSTSEACRCLPSLSWVLEK